MAIPVIDFSKLKGDDKAQTLAQIHTCCQQWGFFQLVNFGISEELLDRAMKVCLDCYKLEREEGFNNSKPVKKLEEIMEKGSQEKVEGFDWEDGFFLLDDHEWPSLTPHFKETMEEYESEMRKVTDNIMEVMDENLGLSKGYIKTTFNGGGGGDHSAIFGTKVSYFPPCPHPERVTALRAHTDAGGLVMCFQDDKVKGLQVLKDGEWIDVQPITNSIVVNTGDQIEVISNGRYKSAWHRVFATPDGNRRSIASFYSPSLKATIAPAPQLVEQAHNNAKSYPKFMFQDYMSVYTDQKFLPKEQRFDAIRMLN